GIAITGASTANGTWFYSMDGGATWLSLGNVSSSSSLLLAANTNNRIYFRPNTNLSGVISNALTFRAWDQTSGTNGARVSTASNGGTSAFSSATENATISVVNNAPVLDANKAPALNSVSEDAPAPAGPVGTLVSSLVDFAIPSGQVDNV